MLIVIIILISITIIIGILSQCKGQIPMLKYSIGDRVLIISDKNKKDSSMTQYMIQKYGGKEMTIKDIEYGLYYKMEQDGGQFAWMESTIERRV
jgi:hypothetical protein